MALPPGTHISYGGKVTLPKGKTYEDTEGTLFPSQQEAAASNSRLGTNPLTREPAVLSSRAGTSAFQKEVQPTIDSANAATDASRKAAEARSKEIAPTVEQLPPDVQAELDANKSEQELVEEKQQAAWDRQEKTARETYQSLTLANKATAAAEINSLTGSWGERRQLLQESNRANVANWNQQFIRTGQAEYSPGMSSDLITGKELEGQRKVKQLDDEYNAAVAAVNAATSQKNFAAAADLTKTLSSIEDKALAQMRENAKEAADVNAKIREKTVQASREMAISDIVKQGITDPMDIQDYLNNTDAGKQIGDITLKEIQDTLKIVNPSADLSGLTADYRTFKALKDAKDPLVDNMNYFGYLRAVGNASRKPEDGIAAGFKFSQTQQSQLLSGNFTSSEVAQMQADIAAHGIDQVVAGVPADQQELVRRVLAGSDSVADIGNEDSIFTRGYVSTLFGIPDTEDKVDSFLGFGGTTGASKLDDIMSRIQTWQGADYTDKEILKELQSD